MRSESALDRGFDVKIEIVYEITFLSLKTESLEQKTERLSLALTGVKLIGNASAVEYLEEIRKLFPIVFENHGIIGKKINSIILCF